MVAYYWLVLVVAVFLPYLCALVWAASGVWRILGRLVKGAPALTIVTASGCRIWRTSGEEEVIHYESNGSVVEARMIRGFPPKRQFIPDTPDDAAMLLYGDRCCAVNIRQRLLYSSRAIERLAGLGWGWLLAPFANLFLAGHAIRLLGMMKYAITFDDGSGGFRFGVSFDSQGTGFLLWVTLWLLLTSAWIWSYFIRTHQLKARVERELARLGPALREFESSQRRVNPDDPGARFKAIEY